MAHSSIGRFGATKRWHSCLRSVSGLPPGVRCLTRLSSRCRSRTRSDVRCATFVILPADGSPDDNRSNLAIRKHRTILEVFGPQDPAGHSKDPCFRMPGPALIVFNLLGQCSDSDGLILTTTENVGSLPISAGYSRFSQQDHTGFSRSEAFHFRTISDSGFDPPQEDRNKK